MGSTADASAERRTHCQRDQRASGQTGGKARRTREVKDIDIQLQKGVQRRLPDAPKSRIAPAPTRRRTILPATFSGAK
jgi:hypothetical protein